ncbi:site-2 protease family protein [Fulvivirgaceae bacterium BMA12]|uniref:Zinc metalloprotease n=1 Tax=Agaribacillus aureus TaxID=3051825 RepID=A0ABT8LIW4_9BACT|nr:site-2 protease family protein [Fulvivirgaceae bacterium BMA12]
MKGTLNLGRVSGIKILIHWTFIFLIAWVVFLEISRGSDGSTIMLSIAFVLVIFGCVVLHELGHALTAKRFGISTRKITLLPIGGVASLEKMPEKPKQELLVAVAGPAVNVAIALLLYLIFPINKFLAGNAGQLEEALGKVTTQNFVFYLFVANIVLVVFNAIPAFPMDGGRILRALLSMTLDRVQATRIAASLGQLMAVLFFFIGLFYNPLLILIAIFVYFGAHSENVMVQHLALLKGHKVNEAMMTNITILSPDQTIGEVVDIVLSGTEVHFVVSENQAVQGVLYQSDFISAMKEKNTHAPVSDFMTKDFEKVGLNEDLSQFYRKVRASKKSFFPVLENDQPVGAIDFNNINEYMLIRSSLDY